MENYPQAQPSCLIQDDPFLIREGAKPPTVVLAKGIQEGLLFCLEKGRAHSVGLVQQGELQALRVRNALHLAHSKGAFRKELLEGGIIKLLPLIAPARVESHVDLAHLEVCHDALHCAPTWFGGGGREFLQKCLGSGSWCWLPGSRRARGPDAAFCS